MISSIKMDNNSIQQLIKERIPKEFMFEYLNTMIIEDSIDGYSSLLDLTEINDKYTFDLIIAILYKEAATIETLLGMIDTYSTTHQSLFEQMVILEYGLYEIPDGLVDSSDNNDSIKSVRNYIPKLYYGDTSKLSYKDEANVLSELNKIFTNTSSYETALPNADLSFPTYTTYVGDVPTVHLDPRFMTRINNMNAYIETKTGLYSFLINYDITNKYFIRKKEALTSGVYRKLENGLEKNGLETEKTFTDISVASELYYSEYLLESPADDATITAYTNAHIFLLDFYDKIIKGTINYWKDVRLHGD